MNLAHQLLVGIHGMESLIGMCHMSSGDDRCPVWTAKSISPNRPGPWMKGGGRARQYAPSCVQKRMRGRFFFGEITAARMWHSRGPRLTDLLHRRCRMPSRASSSVNGWRMISSASSEMLTLHHPFKFLHLLCRSIPLDPRCGQREEQHAVHHAPPSNLRFSISYRWRSALSESSLDWARHASRAASTSSWV